MPALAAQKAVKVPYVHQDFPAFKYSLKAPKGRLFASLDEIAEAVAEDGPGVWFNSPEELPKPVAAVQFDFKARIAELEAENADLRKVNGDLVAKLIAKPEAKPDAKVEAKK